MKKIALTIIVILFVLLFGFLVWLVMPAGKDRVGDIIPAKSFAVLSLELDLYDKGIRGILKPLKNKAISSVKKPFGKFLIWSNTWKFFLPTDITVVFIPDEQREGNKFNWILYSSGNRIGKILKCPIARERFDNLLAKGKPFQTISYKGVNVTKINDKHDEEKSYYYTFLKNWLIVSNEVYLLEESVERYAGHQNKETLKVHDGFRDFMNKKRDGELSLFFQNGSSHEVSDFISNLEEKFSYSIFPNVNSMDWIGLHMDIVDRDSADAVFLFKFSVDVETGDKIENDVYFISETLRRIGRANGLDGRYTIGEEGDFISANWKVKGIKECLRTILSKEVGNK